MTSMKKLTIVTTLFIALSAILLAGCQNTAQGLGKDMEKNTKEVRKAINEN